MNEPSLFAPRRHRALLLGVALLLMCLQTLAVAHDAVHAFHSSDHACVIAGAVAQHGAAIPAEFFFAIHAYRYASTALPRPAALVIDAPSIYQSRAPPFPFHA